jgi:hypothetical protein
MSQLYDAFIERVVIDRSQTAGTKFLAAQEIRVSSKVCGVDINHHYKGC